MLRRRKIYRAHKHAQAGESELANAELKEKEKNREEKQLSEPKKEKK